MPAVEQLRALAAYYRDILATLSYQTGKHLIDLGAVLRYGLTADLGVYLPRPSTLLDEDKIGFRIERMSPEAVSKVVEQAVLREEADATAQPAAGDEAAEEQPDTDRRTVAARLIAIYRKQEQDPFNRETITGWPLVAGKYGTTRFCAPLLYFAVHVHYDPVRSVMSLTRDFEAPALNSYLLAKLTGSDEDTELVRSKLLPYLYRPEFDTQALEEIVRIVAEMVPGLRGLRRDPRPVAPLSAALDAREQSGAALFNTVAITNAKRSNAFLQDDLAVLAKLEELRGETVVDTLLAEVPENIEDVEDPDSLDYREPLLFPLLSNRAQRSMARKAERARLLVVQGPPGTGKSQSITNLVCHLVAHGHSVLVTSHQNKALEVIIDMLPEIDYLALSLLKGEKESVAQLANQLERFSTVVEGKSLKALQQAWQNSLAQIRETEEQVRRLQARFSELKALERDRAAPYRRHHEVRAYDQIHPEDQIPAGAEDHTARALGEWFGHLTTLRDILPDLETLLGGPGASVEAVADVAEKVGRLVSVCQDAQNVVSRAETVGLIRELLQAAGPPGPVLRPLQSWAAWLEGRGTELLAARQALEVTGVGLDSLGGALRQAAALGEGTAQALEERAKQLADTAVRLIREGPLPSGLPSYPTQERLRALKVAAGTLAARAHSWWRWHLTPAAKAARRELLREGMGPGGYRDREEALQQVAKWVRVWSLHTAVVSGLHALREAGIPLPALGPRPASAELATHANLAKTFTHLLAILAGATQASFPGGLRAILERELSALRTANELERLLATLMGTVAHLERLREVQGLQADSALAHLWDGGANLPVQFLQTLEAGPDLQQELQHLRRVLGAAASYRQLLALEATTLNTLPRTRGSLREAALGNLPVPWMERSDLAVAAHRLAAFIREDQVGNPDDIGEIARRIAALQREKRDRILEAIRRGRRIALKQAELDNVARQQVVLLRQLLRRRRKTPSLVQLRGRIDYRRLLQVFPCWVMSIEDVARVFPLEAGLFDYLIVDEASQCNQATALHLAYRAKRLIVVGDRQQLKNPQVRFLADAVVRFLLTKHRLDVHPRAEFLHGRESLLALAEAGANATAFLNEHFRCEPPIIAWSNRHFYDNRLRILTPIRARRFTPVAEVRLVPGADDDLELRQNRREGEAVIGEVRRLLVEREAEGLTIGLLSPFETQATLLHNLLHEAFAHDPGRLREHRLIASTADGFQGDERDIILYSFRYGPSTSPGSIRAIELERERLNVAFSRARRKVVCFISRPVEAFPRGLIQDFLQHAAQIQRDAKSRLQDDTVDRFDSEFERHVCEALRARGLTVRTQVPCGGFFIDLVALDSEGRRLAVECDGEFHYEEDADLRPEDYQRQDIIERSGWVVHRVPARRFYANPGAALDRLLEELGRQPVEADLIGTEMTVGVEEEVEETTEPVEGKGMEPEGAPVLGTSIQAQQEPLLEREQPSLLRPGETAGTLGEGPISDPVSWFRLSHWGKITGRLTPYMNRFCYDLGRRLSRTVRLTERQIRFALRVWASALAQGFDPLLDERRQT